MEIFKFAKVNAKTVRSNVKKMFGSILQRRFGSCGSGYFLHVFCALSCETLETFKEVFVLIHGSFPVCICSTRVCSIFGTNVYAGCNYRS